MAGFFLPIDLAFLGSNLIKVVHGGWFPLIVAIGFVTMMTTWRTGRQLVEARLREHSLMTVEELGEHLVRHGTLRVPGTGVYMTGHAEWVPAAVGRILRALNVLHQHVVFLTVETDRVPYVAPARRLEIVPLGQGFWRAIVRYGFLEQPNVPRAVMQCRAEGVTLDPQAAVYVLSPETIIATPRPGMALWREHLFAFMARNAARPAGFFRIPPSRVLEVAGQIEL